jgi:entericidin B
MSLSRIFLAGCLLCASLATTACNTVSGVGRDIEAAGEAITGTSEKTKEKIK